MESLFKDVHFYIFDKNVERAGDVKAAMKSGGAIREFYLSDVVTHIITDTPIEQSTLSLLNSPLVLHSDWVLISVKCGVQLPTVPFDLCQTKLFSGLTFTTSKLSHDDIQKLAILVMFYGGRFQTRLDHNVTHLVTMETSGAKYQCAQDHSESVKVVTPDYIFDCVDLNKSLEEGDYHPTKLERESGISNEGAGLIVNSAAVESVSEPNVGNGLMQPASLLTPPTSLTTHTESPPTHITAHTPHTNTPNIPVDVSLSTITQSTSLADAGPLTHQTSSTTHTSSQVTSITTSTSITATSTISLQSSVSSKTVHPSHSPLPTHTSSLTCSTADEAPIMSGTAVVSNAVEQLLRGVVMCFCGYQECMDTETVNKWTQVIEQHGGQVLTQYSKEQCTHLLALHKKSVEFAKAFAEGKCIASAHWLNDVLTEQRMFPPRNALHLPTAFKWQLLDAEKYSMTLTNYTGIERELVKDMIKICGIPCTGHLDKQTTHLVCKRPEGKKYIKAREWCVQVVNATFLADIIHSGQVPAVMFPRYVRLGYQEEFTPGSCFESISILKPWVTFMETYSRLHPQFVDHSSTPLTSSQATPTMALGTKDEGQPGAKKQKLDDGSAVVPSRTPVVLITGISQSVAKTMKDAVVELGGQVTERGGECTHIVLPRVTRTIKFLCGISVCDHIVTPAWVEKCVKEGVFVSEDGFALIDKDAEELFGMDIPTSLARAKSRKLLEGFTLHSTASVQPPHTALKDIVQCAGGELLSLVEMRSKFGPHLEQATPAHVFVVSTPEDMAAGLCNEFLSCGLNVYNAELVLTGILKQQLNFSLNKLSPP